VHHHWLVGWFVLLSGVVVAHERRSFEKDTFLAPPKCLHRKRQFATVFSYGVTADKSFGCTPEKIKLHKSSSSLVILILPSAVVQNRIETYSAVHRQQSLKVIARYLRCGRSKAKCLDVCLFHLFIGVLIQNRDDTTMVFDKGYPTQTSTSGGIS
jgi:hypothetical protein